MGAHGLAWDVSDEDIKALYGQNGTIDNQTSFLVARQAFYECKKLVMLLTLSSCTKWK